MTIDRNIPVLLGALCCLVPMHSMKAADGCPDLEGKDAAARLEYLHGDRAKLPSACVVASIKYVGGQHYAQASGTLIQYLDFQDPTAVARRGHILEVYPAIDALYSLRKPVVPELAAAVGDARTAERARENAALAILLIYGADQPEAIAVLVRAAQAQMDPTSAVRLMDKARWLANRCIEATRNECENAVLK